MVMMVVIAGVCRAELDSIQLDALRFHDLPTRWIPAHRAPYFLGMTTDSKPTRVGHNSLSLEPGAELVFAVPSGEFALVSPLRQDSGLTNLRAFVSQDDRIYIETFFTQSASPAGWLVNLSQPSHQLVRLQNIGGNRFDFSLWVSDTEKVDRLLQYSRELPLPTREVRVRTLSNEIFRFWQCEPHRPLRVQVPPDARLRIETRFLYPSSETAMIQRWWIRLRGQKSGLRQFLFQESFAAEGPLMVADRPTAVTRLATAHATLDPTGESIHLEMSAPLLVRIMVMEDSRQFLFDLNRPADVSFQVVEPESNWMPGLFFDLARTRAGFAEALAWGLSVDNNYPESSLIGAALLRDTSAQSPHYKPAADLAAQYWNQNTFYRELPPITKPSRKSAFHSSFATRRLNSPLAPRVVPTIAAQHLGELAERLDRGLFVPLDTDETRYVLPELPVSSRLRVSLFSPSSSEVVVRLHLGSQPSREVRMNSSSKLAEHLFAIDEFTQFYSAARACSESSPVPPEWQQIAVVPVGVLEVPLEAESSNFSLQLVEGSGPAWAVVQYRTGKQFALSEANYLSLRASLGEARMKEIFAGCLAGRHFTNGIEDVLWSSHLQPLLKAIRSDSARFLASVGPDAQFQSERTVAQAFDAAVPLAHEQAGEWLLALEQWREGGNTPEAVFGQIRALQFLGEQTLAERQLRGIYLHTMDRRVRARAQAELAIASAHSILKLRELWSTALVTHGAWGALAPLADAYLADGEAALALISGLLASDRSRTVELAAQRIRWPVVASEFSNHSPSVANRHSRMPAPEILSDFASAALIEATSVSRLFGMFISEPTRPVQILLNGPGRLWGEVRALHENDEPEVHDWLEVSGSVDHVIPIQSRGSEQLRLRGHNAQIGRKHDLVLDLPAGTNRLFLRGLTNRIAMRFEIETGSDRPLGPLNQNHSSQTDATTLYLLLRSGELKEISQVRPSWDTALPSESAFTLPQQQPEFTGTLQEKESVDSSNVLRRMEQLVWIAAHHTNHFRQAVTQGEAIAMAHPHISGVQALSSRLLSQVEWKLIPTVHSSAGIARSEDPAPVSPRQRVREALLRPLLESERRISGNDRLVWTTVETVESTAHLQWTVESPVFWPRLPTTVFLQVNENEPVGNPISTNDWRGEMEVTLGTGQTSVRLWTEPNYPNQYLTVRFPKSHTQRLIPASTFWHVSTSDEPVVLYLEGPTMLRIDERIENKVHAQFRELQPGWQWITFQATNNSPRWLRFSSREPRRSVELKRETQPGEVEEPKLEQSAWPELANLLSDEVFAPGRHLETAPSGTWSIGVSGYQRRYVEEAEDPDLERFVQFDGEHRKRHEDGRGYFFSQVLGRAREEGDPAFGIRHRVSRTLPNSSAGFRAEAAVFGQQPAGDSSEGSGSLRSSLFQLRPLGQDAYHLPALGIFGREFTLSDRSGYPGRMVDQDVFSPYRKNHRWGWELSDTMVYSRWEDVLWLARVSATSNEDLTVDHADGRIEWRQLFGDLQVNGGYSFAWFFDDADRQRDRVRNSLFAAIDWRRGPWTRPGLQLGGLVRHDLDSDITTYVFRLSMHFGKGRGYQDFDAVDIDFRQQRGWRLTRKD